MPVYDYECKACGHIFEVIEGYDETNRHCPICQKLDCHRIISQTGQYCGNQDAPWLKSSNAVVDKDSRHPIDLEFRRNPTRENRERWMRHHGLREYEPGMRMKPEEPKHDTDPRVTKHLMRELQKRRRIEINR